MTYVAKTSACITFINNCGFYIDFLAEKHINIILRTFVPRFNESHLIVAQLSCRTTTSKGILKSTSNFPSPEDFEGF